jgi:hypothetical protein
MEQAEIDRQFNYLHTVRKKQGKTYNLKETGHILNFLYGLGEKGLNMAYTFYNYIEEIENEPPPPGFEEFLEKYNLNDYYNELRIFINACQYGQKRYEYLEENTKKQIRTQVINNFDYERNYSLKNDLDWINSLNLKSSEIREKKPFSVNSISVSYKGQSKTLNSDPICEFLEKELNRAISVYFSMYATGQYNNTIDKKSFARDFLIPVYKYLEKKDPDQSQNKRSEIVMKFWRVFFKYPYDFSYFKKLLSGKS